METDELHMNIILYNVEHSHFPLPIERRLTDGLRSDRDVLLNIERLVEQVSAICEQKRVSRCGGQQHARQIVSWEDWYDLANRRRRRLCQVGVERRPHLGMLCRRLRQRKGRVRPKRGAPQSFQCPLEDTVGVTALPAVASDPVDATAANVHIETSAHLIESQRLVSEVAKVIAPYRAPKREAKCSLALRECA